MTTASLLLALDSEQRAAVTAPADAVIVLEIADTSITGQGALIAAIRDTAPGETITIIVERNKERVELTATLVARPQE